jgi:hypothetical protein
MEIQSFQRRLLTAVAVLVSLTCDTGGATAPIAATPRVAPQRRASREPESSTSARKPKGIYAVVVLEETRGAGTADFDVLVKNPAVSGLAVRVFWSALQPEKERYDFSRLDAAFASAEAAHKTVQLILVPGFGTPAWVLSEISSCDDQLPALTDTGGRAGDARGGRAAGARGGRTGGRAGRGAAAGGGSTSASGGGATCGKASFDVSEGRGRGQSQELPLPWNPVYKSYWKAFLTEVASRLGPRDAFVSIAVAGPTAQSVEIILPRAGEQLERWGQLLQMSYRDPSYHRSDKAFLEEWDAAVTVYGQVFHNVTIVLTRGSGLLDFTKGQGSEAQASITSSFAGHAVGSNAKATQTSGLKACRETEGGIKGVKEMSSSGPVLGGAQFDTSFSQKPAAEGCPASCDAQSAACLSTTPAQALSNVLSVYFDDTPDGGQYGASKGPARMNYMQIYEKDILYANTQPAVQAVLLQASQRLLAQAR